MSVKVSQAERMINLLALLVERSRPLTLKQIRRELGNQYSDQDEAARAAFERDKAELRKMGIPIEMVTLGGDQAGEGGYTIDRRSFLLADLKLTDAERAALELAIATVRMGAVVGEGALWKLGGERVTKAPATSVNVQLTDEVLRSLAAGVIDRKSLTFTYKSEKRTVDPYGLLARGGFCISSATTTCVEHSASFAWIASSPRSVSSIRRSSARLTSTSSPPYRPSETCSPMGRLPTPMPSFVSMNPLRLACAMNLANLRSSRRTRTDRWTSASRVRTSPRSAHGCSQWWIVPKFSHPRTYATTSLRRCARWLVVHREAASPTSWSA